MICRHSDVLQQQNEEVRLDLPYLYLEVFLQQDPAGHPFLNLLLQILCEAHQVLMHRNQRHNNYLRYYLPCSLQVLQAVLYDAESVQHPHPSLSHHS